MNLARTPALSCPTGEGARRAGEGDLRRFMAGEQVRKEQETPTDLSRVGRAVSSPRSTARQRRHALPEQDLPRRLLLGQAMERAEAQDEIHGVNAHDGAVLEQLAQDAKGHAIVRIVERGHENGVVGDVEVRVARRQAIILEVKRRRHGERHDLRLRAVLEPQILDALPVLGERTGIDVPAVFSRMSTTVRGLTNRQTSSTCPWVSSPTGPATSQNTFVAPR